MTQPLDYTRYWEKMQAGECPYCGGRGKTKVEGPVDAEQQQRIHVASVLFHIAVAHEEEAVDAAVAQWHAQIELRRWATANVRCPLRDVPGIGCTFRCQIPTERAIPVIWSHLKGAHRVALLGAATAALTPALLLLWALIALLRLWL